MSTPSPGRLSAVTLCTILGCTETARTLYEDDDALCLDHARERGPAGRVRLRRPSGTWREPPRADSVAAWKQRSLHDRAAELEAEAQRNAARSAQVLAEAQDELAAAAQAVLYTPAPTAEPMASPSPTPGAPAPAPPSPLEPTMPTEEEQAVEAQATKAQTTEAPMMCPVHPDRVATDYRVCDPNCTVSVRTACRRWLNRPPTPGQRQYLPEPGSKREQAVLVIDADRFLGSTHTDDQKRAFRAMRAALEARRDEAGVALDNDCDDSQDDRSGPGPQDDAAEPVDAVASTTADTDTDTDDCDTEPPGEDPSEIEATATTTTATPEEPPSVQMTVDLLSLVVEPYQLPPEGVVAGWGAAELEAVWDRAGGLHLAASDNDVEVPEVPTVLLEWMQRPRPSTTETVDMGSLAAIHGSAGDDLLDSWWAAQDRADELWLESRRLEQESLVLRQAADRVLLPRALAELADTPDLLSPLMRAVLDIASRDPDLTDEAAKVRTTAIEALATLKRITEQLRNVVGEQADKMGVSCAAK